jgi:hypothetical protein
VQRLRHEPEAVRREAGTELEGDQDDGRDDRNERCSAPGIHGFAA